MNPNLADPLLLTTIKLLRQLSLQPSLMIQHTRLIRVKRLNAASRLRSPSYSVNPLLLVAFLCACYELAFLVLDRLNGAGGCGLRERVLGGLAVVDVGCDGDADGLALVVEVIRDVLVLC